MLNREALKPLVSGLFCGFRMHIPAIKGVYDLVDNVYFGRASLVRYNMIRISPFVSGAKTIQAGYGSA
ncbi:MAG: hypothetical protein MI976_22880 [Pseudomonadales bacterium]|nr:hypothetical protein [Pseudomonadales bacterium]